MTERPFMKTPSGICRIIELVSNFRKLSVKAYFKIEILGFYDLSCEHFYHCVMNKVSLQNIYYQI